MDTIEKLIFLTITNKQFSKFNSPEYYEVWNLLNDNQKKEFSKLSNEIHDIWNNLNSSFAPNGKIKYDSLQDIVDKEKISPIIIKVARDFNLDFKTEMSEQLKQNIIKLFGEDYFKKNFGRT